MSGPVAMTADDHFARACAERDRADEWVKRADDLSKKLEAAEAARDEATRRLAALEAEDATEADALRVAVEDHLPVYALSEDDDDAANHAERIEYAGDEIKSLTRRLAVVEEAVERACHSLGTMDRALDYTDAPHLRAITTRLRAALEKQP